MNTAHTLPTRRDRLTTIVRLKFQNRWLRLGLICMVSAVIALALMVARAPDPRAQVALGAGMAGVDTALPAFRGDPARPIAEATIAAVETMVANTTRLLGMGEASYYGERFAGRPTASGEIFDPRRMTAAHRTLPIGSRVRVTDRASGRSVIVRINDRGPYHGRRVIDLSEAAARKLGMLGRGTANVRLSLLLT